MYDSVIDVLVVGAGPYGLSVGAYARHVGLRVRVIGTPMDFWRNNMPTGMFLKSEPFASSLGSPVPGLSFREYNGGWPEGLPIPIHTFISYGQWFAEHAAPEPEPSQVLRVEGEPGRVYTVTLSTGEEVRTRTVVLAVGVGPFAHVPRQLASLPTSLVTHSVVHREFDRFADKEVIVVGAGQSALETAVLLADCGARPVVLARTPQLEWNALPGKTSSPLQTLLHGPQSGLGRGWRTWVWSEHPQTVRYLPTRTRQHIVKNTLGPAGAWWLRDRMDSRVGRMLGRRVVNAAPHGDGQVRLIVEDRRGDRTEVRADHVIAATGYVPDVDRISVLPPDLRRRLRRTLLSPALDANFQSSLPGLYFAGLTAAATFGPVMRFVHGADFAARRIVGHLSETMGTGTAQQDMIAYPHEATMPR
ncbi:MULTISPECIES: NAD(P)-binding domain-containing protein [Actinomadura]|uniref:FAD/NAD(P)-binding domain-containing protein n=1 Tax=Actinomadura miaoliensis TaxID=430685 RepID=A0ABP7WMK4_9ACTN